MDHASKQREYAFFLSFSSFVGTFFFLGVYFKLLRTMWLSILVGGMITWLFLTLWTRLTHPLRPGSPFQRFLGLAAIAYGGFALYAFFEFIRRCLFPDSIFLFFPICFLPFAALGTSSGIKTLERASKFSSVTVMVLLILTVISMTQKLWSEKDFITRTWPDLFQVDTESFVIQTVIATAILMFQALTLVAVLDEPREQAAFLRSIRRSLIPSVVASALLHFISAVALGAYSFEYLTYPLYDMLSLPGYAEYLDRTELLMLVISVFCEGCKTIGFFLAGRTLFLPTEKPAPKGTAAGE